MRVVLATMILSAFCAGAAESTDVTLAIPAAGERLVERIDPKGAERTTVSFAVPISDIQQLWTPDLKQKGIILLSDILHLLYHLRCRLFFCFRHKQNRLVGQERAGAGRPAVIGQQHPPAGGVFVLPL